MRRRTFMASTIGAAVAAQTLTGLPVQASGGLASLWDVDRSVTNLENAYWGVMPKAVNAEYLAQTDYLNRHNVVFVRDGIPGHERTVAMENVRRKLATLMAAPAEEFVLTRNGTEAMQNLIM